MYYENKHSNYEVFLTYLMRFLPQLKIHRFSVTGLNLALNLLLAMHLLSL